MAKSMMGIYNEAKSSSKKAKKKISGMNIEAADNGGFAVRHNFEQSGPGYVEPENHVFSSAPEMVAHVMKMHNVKAADLKGDNESEPGGKSGMEEGEERDEGEKKPAKQKRSKAEEKGED